MRLFCRMKKVDEPYSIGPANGIVNWYVDRHQVTLCLRWHHDIMQGHCWVDLVPAVGLFIEAWRSTTHGFYKELRWASKS